MVGGVPAGDAHDVGAGGGVDVPASAVGETVDAEEIGDVQTVAVEDTPAAEKTVGAEETVVVLVGAVEGAGNVRTIFVWRKWASREFVDDGKRSTDQIQPRVGCGGWDRRRVGHGVGRCGGWLWRG